MNTSRSARKSKNAPYSRKSNASRAQKKHAKAPQHDYHSEAEFESEDDGFDHHRQVQLLHKHVVDDALEDSDSEMEDDPPLVHTSLKGMRVPPPPPTVMFDDEGESEVDERESDEEPDVPLSTVRKPAATYDSQSTPLGTPKAQDNRLHIKQRLPLELETAVPSSSVVSETNPRSTPSVSRTRASPYTYPPVYHPRAWLVPTPHAMHVKRRQMIYAEAATSSERELSPPPTRAPPAPIPVSASTPSPAPLSARALSAINSGVLPAFQVIKQDKPATRRQGRRPYPCLYRGCGLAFPSPKDRGRHMDRHFEGRFECLRCNKRYARLDALKRHCSGQFRARPPYGVTLRPVTGSVACAGGFEANDWVELSASRWLKPEYVLHLRLPDPSDPLHSQISELMKEARDSGLEPPEVEKPQPPRGRRPNYSPHPPPEDFAEAEQPRIFQRTSPSPTSRASEREMPAGCSVAVKTEPADYELLDVGMVVDDSENRNIQSPSSNLSAHRSSQMHNQSDAPHATTSFAPPMASLTPPTLAM